MIPKQQLEILKPLPDQLKRQRMVKSKRSISVRKGRLTKRARQWALWIQSLRYQSISEPKGVRWKGNKPMKERKKNE
jgi:hypothetical protein